MGKAILIASMMLAMAASAGAKPGQGNPHQQNQGASVGYGVGGCPPGLAKKNNGCLPPGQAKKLYNVGQRYPRSYGTPWSYNQIPYDLRNQYGLNPYGNYYYGDGYLYRVDPKTQLIQQVISALLYR